ncbi:transporter substrate-binding domain-containing protein [Mitsuaria sp. WAJ17]|uniref:substrate-binding periplasmic protein n=1 Tax=Mitsuaria sp. WAJ17 TaxID=2761452 RepID=UPI0016016638|nr:transporter substrate-binding domain-containing protein [Mitsuaria sp. WAJ17]MBB2485118.1 transporter substrate-binding domain-containing protein [Mitsuaria sp. WAJ17]
MSPHGRQLSSLAGLALALAASAAPAAVVRIATGELPPYATAEANDSGTALQIVRRAFALAGHEVRYQFMPWQRAQNETRVGLWDASAYWGANEERRRDFLLSSNVMSEQWVIVHRRDRPLTWRSLADLKPYMLGVIKGYTYTPEFWRMARKGELRTDGTPDDLAGLRKLLLGRLDAMPMERGTACYLLLSQFSTEDARQIDYHPRLLTDSFTTHVIFPKDKPGSPQLLEDFNRGLKQLQASGEYQRLLRGVACPQHWQESAGRH